MSCLELSTPLEEWEACHRSSCLLLEVNWTRRGAGWSVELTDFMGYPWLSLVDWLFLGVILLKLLEITKIIGDCVVTHSTGTVFNQLIEWDGIGVFYIGSAGYMNYREVQNHGDIYRIWLAKGHDTLWWIQQLRAVDVPLQHVDKSG
jgi:hypothetical protein